MPGFFLRSLLGRARLVLCFCFLLITITSLLLVLYTGGARVLTEAKLELERSSFADADKARHTGWTARTRPFPFLLSSHAARCVRKHALTVSHPGDAAAAEFKARRSSRFQHVHSPRAADADAVGYGAMAERLTGFEGQVGRLLQSFGDPALAARVQAAAQGDLSMEPAALLALLAPLPFSARVALACKLASHSSADGVNAMVRGLLPEGGGGGGGAEESDSEWEVIFPRGTAADVSYDQRQLALFIAAAAKDGGVVLRELDGQSKLMKKLARQKVCGAKAKDGSFVVPDAEILARLTFGEDVKPKDRQLLLSSCVRNRRAAVLDAVLPPMTAEHHLRIDQYLHGASSPTVKALLPACMKLSVLRGRGCGLKWDRLWQFHSAVLLALLREQLEAVNCLQATSVWDRWAQHLKTATSEDCSLLLHGSAVKAAIFELMLTHPSVSLVHMARDSPIKLAIEQAAQDGTLSARDFPKEISFQLRSWQLGIMNECLQVDSIQARALQTVQEYADIVAKDANIAAQMHPLVMRLCDRVCGQATFPAIKAILRSLVANVKVSHLYGALSASSPQFQLAHTMIGHLVTQDLPAGMMVELLSVLKDASAAAAPTAEMFGAQREEAQSGDSLVSLLISDETINDKLSNWWSVASFKAAEVIQALCLRQMKAAAAGRDTSSLDAAITAIVQNHIGGALQSLENSGLEATWKTVVNTISGLRTQHLQMLNSTRTDLSECAWARDRRGKNLDVSASATLCKLTQGVVAAEIDRATAALDAVLSKIDQATATAAEAKTVLKARVDALRQISEVVTVPTRNAYGTYSSAAAGGLERLVPQQVEQLLELCAATLKPMVADTYYKAADPAFGGAGVEHWKRSGAMAEHVLALRLLPSEVHARAADDPLWQVAWTLFTDSLNAQHSGNRGRSANGQVPNSAAMAGTKFWQVLETLPFALRQQELPQIIVYLESRSAQEQSFPTQKVRHILGQPLAADTKAAVLRLVLSAKDAPNQFQQQLEASLPIGEPGVRAALQKACATKLPAERVQGMASLLRASLHTYDPEWSGEFKAQNDPFHGGENRGGVAKTPRQAEVEAHAANLNHIRRQEVTATLRFIAKRVENEQLEYRNEIMDNIGGNARAIVTTLLNSDKSADAELDADIAEQRTVWLQLQGEALQAVAAAVNSPARRELLEYFRDLANGFINAGSAALLEIGAELAWRLANQSLSGKQLASNFVLRSAVLGESAEQQLQHAELILSAYEERLGEGVVESTALKTDQACSRVCSLVQLAGVHYAQSSRLRGMVKNILEKPLDPRQRKIADMVLGVYPQLPFTGDYDSQQRRARRKWGVSSLPQAFHQDELLVAYIERTLKEQGNTHGDLDTVLQMRCARTDVIQGRKPGDESDVDMPKESRSQQQLRVAAGLASVYAMDPTSAVLVQHIRDFILRFRQDVILPAHLSADNADQLEGLFKAGSLSNESEGSDDDDDDEDVEPWRWPPAEKGSFLNGRQDFSRLGEAQLKPLRDALLADAADANKPVRDRTLAAMRVMELPDGCLISDLRPLLDKQPPADDAPDGTADESLPKPVAIVFIRGMMNGDSPMDTFRYLLEPATIVRNKELGLSPMQIVRHAAAFLKPAETPGLIRTLLNDPKRAKILGVSSAKEMLRLLFDTNTAASHGLLLELCVKNPRMMQHRDVKSVLIHCLLSMMDARMTPALLVSADAIWDALEAIAADAALEAEVKATLLCAVALTHNVNASQKSGSRGARSARDCLRDATGGWSPQDTASLRNLLEQIDNMGRITLNEPAHCKRLGRVVIILSQGPEVDEEAQEGAAAGGTVTAEDKLANQKAREALMAKLALLDLRCLALLSLVRFSGLESTPNELDGEIEERLVAAVTSNAAFDTSSSDTNHARRTAIMLSAVPRQLCYVAAHHAHASYMGGNIVPLSTEHEVGVDVREVGADAAGPLPAVIDALLSAALNREALSQELRRVAVRRLSEIAAELKGAKSSAGCSALRYGEQAGSCAAMKPSDAQGYARRLNEHAEQMLLTRRCKTELQWLRDEAALLATLLN